MAVKMRLGTPDYVKDLAKQNRQNQTMPEALLWAKLRNNQLAGYKFYRQCPIGRYVADFFCGQVNLVIELDGGIHKAYRQAEYDKVRQSEIEGRNMKVLRFSLPPPTILWGRGWGEGLQGRGLKAEAIPSD